MNDLSSMVLSPVPLSDLLEGLRQVVKEEVLAGQQKQLDEKLLSPGEVCKLFVPAITRPTLDKLCNEGRLTKRYLQSRVYFKYSDVMAVLKTYHRYEQSK